jgi:glycosyltransferase involved in cell wall biosynthesis
MVVAQDQPEVHIIVPARNEQDCLARCLDSLVHQQGIAFQITVVDDNSRDRTRAIAESFSGIRVISATEPANGITGKCNAFICGASGVTAEWFLFTDADTFHYAGSLTAAVKEARDRAVDLLSYSPEQEAVSWSEQALMPVVFAELARTFPPDRVNNPLDPLAAVNGQYLLVRRTTYEKLGGYQAVASSVLEDVELARLAKSSGCKIWFRHGEGSVSTRMYRNFSAMVEGWTKNLALLFRHPVLLAVLRMLEFVIIIASLSAGAVLMREGNYSPGGVLLLLGLLLYVNFLVRILAAHFPWKATMISITGLPLFSFLLLRSYIHSRVRGAVSWKGRTYVRIP